MSIYNPETKNIITGHKALREALRDTETYSSDLQGDADVRWKSIHHDITYTERR
jgi:hypothetical protein